MKTRFVLILSIIILLFAFSTSKTGQPDLGVATNFVLFTSVGAFNNTGLSKIDGDVGTNIGAFTGFPPGTINGDIYIANATSAQAATDLTIAYNYLDGISGGIPTGTILGNGQILTPNVYTLGAASSLTGNLILDGQGDPDATFIFQIDGALAAASLSQIVLINSTRLCNVFWQVNGEFILGANSVFNGSLIANGAITIIDGSKYMGRCLSISGAINIDNCTVAIGIQPSVTISSLSGLTLCSGDSITLIAAASKGVAPYTYLWLPGGETDSSITVSPLETTTYCVNVESLNACLPGTDSVTVIVNLSPFVTANINELTGDSITLTGGGADSYIWSDGVLDGVSFIPYATNIYTVVGTDLNNCSSSSEITITVGALPIGLIQFIAYSSGSNIRLDWSTTSEINNDYFTIQKSRNGLYFEDLLNTNGSGNSNKLIRYSAYDREPYEGVSYYRIKQTDFDGVFSYSNLLSVNVSPPNEFDIGPNPFGKFIIVKSHEEIFLSAVELYIFDSDGEEVIHSIIGQQSTTQSTNSLTSGIYFYKMLCENKIIKSGKLICQQ